MASSQTKARKLRFWLNFEGFFNFRGKGDFSQANEIYQFVPHVVLHVSTKFQEKVMTRFRIKSIKRLGYNYIEDNLDNNNTQHTDSATLFY